MDRRLSMKNRIRALFLLSSALCTAMLLRAPISYGDELEDHPQKSFNVHPRGTLTFASEYGAGKVKGGEAQTATIQLDRDVHAFTTEEAKKILDDLEIEASQEGDTIHYRAKFKTGWEPSDEGGGAGRSLCRDHRCLSYAGNLRQMDFTITVPKHLYLHLTPYVGHMAIAAIDRMYDS